MRATWACLAGLAVGCGSRGPAAHDDAAGMGVACAPDDPAACEVTVGGPSGGGEGCGPAETFMTWVSGDQAVSSCTEIAASCEGCCPTCDCMGDLCEAGQRCVVEYDVLVGGKDGKELDTLLLCTDAGECPDPVVFCDAAPPDCEFGTYPQADPCDGGYCPERCWTGACLPCGTECHEDKTCTLVGRHGCCGPSGDCQGCTWAAPWDALGDECFFEQPACPPPDPPAGCATTCVDDPLCSACPHCAPQAARCEGGHCVSAWTQCEPECLCD